MYCVINKCMELGSSMVYKPCTGQCTKVPTNDHLRVYQAHTVPAANGNTLKYFTITLSMSLVS